MTRKRASSFACSSGRSTTYTPSIIERFGALEPTPLDILIRNAAGEIVGGLIASTYWGWLEVNILWIAEGLRRLGHGRTLLRMAEAEARTRGCAHVMLTTYSFQARGFYEKEGYRVVGEMAGYPPGAVYYWMRKDL